MKFRRGHILSKSGEAFGQDGVVSVNLDDSDWEGTGLRPGRRAAMRLLIVQRRAFFRQSRRSVRSGVRETRFELGPRTLQEIVLTRCHDRETSQRER